MLTQWQKLSLKEGMISFQEEQTNMMLIDLRNKGISGKEAENAL
jgi:hypothetical protein